MTGTRSRRFRHLSRRFPPMTPPVCSSQGSTPKIDVDGAVPVNARQTSTLCDVAQKALRATATAAKAEVRGCPTCCMSHVRQW